MSDPHHLERVFHDDLAADRAAERRLLVKELVIAAIIGLLVALREVLL